MSGTTIKLKGVDHARTADRVMLPVMRSLEYANFFVPGSDPARNLAPNKRWGRAVGYPYPSFEDAGSMVFETGKNFIETSIYDTRDQTLIHIARTVGAGANTEAISIGSYGPSPGAGASLMLAGKADGSSKVLAPTARNNGSGAEGLLLNEVGEVPNTVNWHMAVARVGFDSFSMDTFAGGATGPRGDVAMPQRILTGASYRIGSGYSVNTSRIQIAAVLQYSALLTTPEITALVAYLRPRMFSVGIGF